MNALTIQSTDLAPRGASVPPDDLEEFMQISEPRRVEVLVALRIIERLKAEIPARGKMAALRFVAASSQHQMRGLSAVSLDRKLKAYEAGGWRALVKGYRGPNAQPKEFVEEVRRVAELNHRSQGEAFRQLRERWERGEAIPGYGTWVDYWQQQRPFESVPTRWPRGFYPAGWSIDNLRRYGPSKGTRALVQRGFAAAKRHFPSVQRDPSQLRPLELIVIDDFELDSLCVFPGDREHRPQIAPIAGLLAMDVGTRRKLHWGLGPRLEREEKQPDGTIRKIRSGIRRVDVQMLLHDIFAKYGLPDYTCTILVENATASISAELELALTTLFDGRVKVERTGLIHNRTLTNGFTERGGKPWQKGWIESLFNHLWNVLGSQKGYKGSNARLNGPASIEDAKRYTARLIGQGEGKLNLPPEAIAEMALPFPSPDEAERAFAWAISISDSRTDHKYLGFDRVTEYLIEGGEEPLPFAALAQYSKDSQMLAEPVERMESPAERWQRLQASVEFRPVPSSVLALLLLTPKKAEYKDHRITFVHDRVGYTYVDRTGQILADVSEGTELLCYLNQRDPEMLHVATVQGAYVGALERLGGRTGMVDIRDKAALAEAGEVQATIVNRAVAEIRGRHAGADAQLAADRLHNEAVVAKYQAPQQIAAAVDQRQKVKSESKARATALQSLTDADVPDLL